MSISFYFPRFIRRFFLLYSYSEKDRRVGITRIEIQYRIEKEMKENNKNKRKGRRVIRKNMFISILILINVYLCVRWEVCTSHRFLFSESFLIVYEYFSNEYEAKILAMLVAPNVHFHRSYHRLSLPISSMFLFPNWFLFFVFFPSMHHIHVSFLNRRGASLNSN